MCLCWVHGPHITCYKYLSQSRICKCIGERFMSQSACIVGLVFDFGCVSLSPRRPFSHFISPHFCCLSHTLSLCVDALWKKKTGSHCGQLYLLPLYCYIIKSCKTVLRHSAITRSTRSYVSRLKFCLKLTCIVVYRFYSMPEKSILHSHGKRAFSMAYFLFTYRDQLWDLYEKIMGISVLWNSYKRFSDCRLEFCSTSRAM